ncbi:MAG: PP0621 family protein [Gallionella sp.]
MSRLLLLIAIAIVVYLLLKSNRKRPPVQDEPVVEDMVRCAHCGVHLPKSESVLSGGKFFCSVEHRDAYRRRT